MFLACFSLDFIIYADFDILDIYLKAL